VTETAARSAAVYLASACRLAGGAAWRTTIRAAIASRLSQSGLADFDRYARALEAAYESAVALKPAPTT
jgi:predicted O-linked N-acetylglucosamine transferase (SPINDLY family)